MRLVCSTPIDVIGWHNINDCGREGVAFADNPVNDSTLARKTRTSCATDTGANSQDVEAQFPVVAPNNSSFAGYCQSCPPPKLDNGQPCNDAGECASNFCVDGVCCDDQCGSGDASDCEACSIEMGATNDGTCGPVTAGLLCRNAASECDAVESCDGLSVNCPSDANQPECTPCTGGMCVAGVCVMPGDGCGAGGEGAGGESGSGGGPSSGGQHDAGASTGGGAAGGQGDSDAAAGGAPSNAGGNATYGGTSASGGASETGGSAGTLGESGGVAAHAGVAGGLGGGADNDAGCSCSVIGGVHRQRWLAGLVLAAALALRLRRRQ